MPSLRVRQSPDRSGASRRSGRGLLATVALLLGTALATVAPAAPAHAAAKTTTCTPAKYPGSGYFTSLRVTGTSCAQGNKLAIAYYKCRTKKSKSGRCTTKVLRYTCTDKRTAIPTEINGRVTCRKGKATIVHTYQQNT